MRGNKEEEEIASYHNNVEASDEKAEHWFDSGGGDILSGIQ